MENLHLIKLHERIRKGSQKHLKGSLEESQCHFWNEFRLFLEGMQNIEWINDDNFELRNPYSLHYHAFNFRNKDIRNGIYIALHVLKKKPIIRIAVFFDPVSKNINNKNKIIQFYDELFSKKNEINCQFLQPLIWESCINIKRRKIFIEENKNFLDLSQKEDIFYYFYINMYNITKVLQPYFDGI